MSVFVFSNGVYGGGPHGGCSHIGIAASDMKVTCQLDALRPPNKGAIRGIYSIRWIGAHGGTSLCMIIGCVYTVCV